MLTIISKKHVLNVDIRRLYKAAFFILIRNNVSKKNSNKRTCCKLIVCCSFSAQVAYNVRTTCFVCTFLCQYHGTERNIEGLDQLYSWWEMDRKSESFSKWPSYISFYFRDPSTDFTLVVATVLVKSTK